MNQDTLTRLGWVIEAVEKAPLRQFNMDYWQHRRWFCGTSHCAIGWACQDERVQASGLLLFGACGDMEPRLGLKRGFAAIARWLDIPEADARQLFGPRSRSGKDKEEVLQRLKTYRSLVSYELGRQAPQAGPVQQEEEPLPIAERIARGMRMQPDPAPRNEDALSVGEYLSRGFGYPPSQTQQAQPASSAAPKAQAVKAPLDAATEGESCES